MVRAPRYGYERPHPPGYFSSRYRPLWQEPERLDDKNIFLRQLEGPGLDENLPSYAPAIDQQPYEPKSWQEPKLFQKALSENLPPAAGYGDIYDQMGETNRRNRGVGGLIRRVNPFDNAQPPADSAWKSPAQTLQEWKDQRASERDPLISREAQPPGAAPLIRGRPDSPFPPAGLPGQQSTQGIADVFGGGPPPPPPPSSSADLFAPPSGFTQGFSGGDAGTAPLIAGPSISDRVRGNRYANMSPEDREALNFTIAGELHPSSYGTPEGDQEVANMVETITTRAAQKGKSIEDIVKENRQYSPWNTLDTRAITRGLLKEHGPDVRRMVSNAVTGEVMPTNEGLTSYHATSMNPKPPWARGIEPSARAGKHSFYTDIAPWSSSPAGPPLPAAPVDRAITSQDIGPPPLASMIAGRPDAPLGGMPAAPTPTQMVRPEGPPGGMPAAPASPLTDPAADPLARPLSPTNQFDDSIDQTLAVGGGGNQLPSRPLIAPSPLTPEQVTAGQQRVNEMLDPALEAAKNVPPALAPDTRYDSLSAATMGPSAPPGPRPPLVKPSSLPSPAPMLGNPLGVDMMNPTPITIPGRDQTLAPMAAPPLIGSDRPAPVQSEIVQPPLGPLGDYTLGSDRKLRPPSAGPPPLVAPAAAVPSGAPLVTPRRTVTPQTPVSPEPESNLPPLPSTTVPAVTPAPVQPLIEPAAMSTPAPLIAPPATTPINPRLSPKEIERRARERGFGTVENLTGDRIARGVGAGIGAVGGLMVGGLPGAATFGGIGYRNADDMRRSYMNRSGLFGLFGLGNIFGFGRDRDKDKEKRANGTPPKDSSASRAPAGMGGSGGSGLGSDRANYGYSTGGRDIDEGVGGRYGQR